MQNENQNLLDQQFIGEAKRNKTIQSWGAFLRNLVLIIVSLLLGYWFATRGIEVNGFFSFIFVVGSFCLIPRAIQAWGEVLTQILYKEMVFLPGAMIVKARIWGMKDVYYPMNYAYINVRKVTNFRWHESYHLYGTATEEARFERISRLIYLFKDRELDIASGTGCRWTEGRLEKFIYKSKELEHSFVTSNTLYWGYRGTYLQESLLPRTLTGLLMILFSCFIFHHFFRVD